jgi:tetratricopeptide (TPR) repeat protein
MSFSRILTCRPGRLIGCLLATIAFSILVVPSFAETTVTINAEKQLQYAQQLFSQKKYILAIAEYERFIYLFPGNMRAPEARFNIGMAYYSEKQYPEAIQTFNELSGAVDKGSAYQARSFFLAAESQTRIGLQSSALTTLNNLATLSDDMDVKDEAHYRMGWIFLETANWERAQTYFQKISHPNHTKYRLADLNKNFKNTANIHHKSPAMAGALAILPGAGYLYCNRPRDALISFLLNGGLIFAAYEAFDNDMVALGGVISFVEIGFYSGNIYGSISSAHKYNQDQDRRFVDRLKENLKVNLSSRPENKGLELSLQYHF